MLSRYAPAIIQFSIVLVGAFAQISGHITLVDALQLIPLAANALLVYLVPLFGASMRSGWKTGVAVIGALAAAAIPFATTHQITGAQVAIVILAGLQVLGAHIGVQIRNGATPGTGALLAPTSPPPVVTTDTMHIDAINNNGGEFVGEAAR